MSKSQAVGEDFAREACEGVFLSEFIHTIFSVNSIYYNESISHGLLVSCAGVVILV